MKKLSVAIGLTLVAFLTAIASVHADPAFTETTTVKGVTENFTDVICEDGKLYDITVTYNGIEHITVKGNTVHVTFTQTGKFTAVDPDTGEVITGSFTVWGGFNATLQDIEDPASDIVPGTPAQGTFTFSARGMGDMGTRIQTSNVEHFNVTPNFEPGDDHNEFFHGHCNIR